MTTVFLQIFQTTNIIPKYHLQVAWINFALHFLLAVHSFACICLQFLKKKQWFRWTSISIYTSFVSNIFVVVTSGLFLEGKSGWWSSTEVQWSLTAMSFMGNFGDIIRLFRWLKRGTNQVHGCTNRGSICEVGIRWV